MDDEAGRGPTPSRGMLHSPAWWSAGAAMLTALVGAIALLVPFLSSESDSDEEATTRVVADDDADSVDVDIEFRPVASTSDAVELARAVAAKVLPEGRPWTSFEEVEAGGSVLVEAPREWSDVKSGIWRSDQVPEEENHFVGRYVSASENLDRWWPEQSVPGITVWGTDKIFKPYGHNVSVYEDEAGCFYIGGDDVLTRGSETGGYEFWACADGDAVLFVHWNNHGSDYQTILEFTMTTEGDVTALERALESMRVEPPIRDEITTTTRRSGLTGSNRNP